MRSVIADRPRNIGNLIACETVHISSLIEELIRHAAQLGSIAIAHAKLAMVDRIPRRNGVRRLRCSLVFALTAARPNR